MSGSRMSIANLLSVERTNPISCGLLSRDASSQCQFVSPRNGELLLRKDEVVAPEHVGETFSRDASTGSLRVRQALRASPTYRSRLFRSPGFLDGATTQISS